MIFEHQSKQNTGYLWEQGQTECITWEFPGNFKKKGHVLDLNIRESNEFSSCGVRRYSGEVPSDFEEVVNIKMAAAK